MDVAKISRDDYSQLVEYYNVLITEVDSDRIFIIDNPVWYLINVNVSNLEAINYISKLCSEITIHAYTNLYDAEDDIHKLEINLILESELKENNCINLLYDFLF